MIYDTTLREGMQSANISFTVENKIKLVKILDDIGVDFIEGGQPASNPKDDLFYKRLTGIKLKHAKLVAFGSTCKVNIEPENDPMLTKLAQAGTEYVCIFGKCSASQVSDILGTTTDNNISMIRKSIRYLKKLGKIVIFDCEHFFDGYKQNKEYALECVHAAIEEGAWGIVLCDTNGSTMPYETEEILNELSYLKNTTMLGIHCHNDCGMADANALIAAHMGLSIINVSLYGLGERCGNSDFFTTVPNIQLKLGKRCISDDALRSLNAVSYVVAEILNMKPNTKAPYIGRNAFGHKGGMHIDAVYKSPSSFEHIDPELVGGQRRFLLSEVSGRNGLSQRVKSILNIEYDDNKTEEILSKLKRLELEGYQFEGAEASFVLLVKKMYGIYKPIFKLNSYKVITMEAETSRNESASAIVDMEVNGKQEVTAANGVGPVDALDNALRKALGRFYTEAGNMRLIDYKVRVLDSSAATASVVRVFIESACDEKRWCTLGVSCDIIEASWCALVDAYEYMLT